MKHKILLILGCVLVLSSCAETEARRPITQKTGTVLSETIDERKKLNASEIRFIEQYIAQDSTKAYQTSSDGFWYHYETKVEEALKTPKIGDVVEFTYNITSLYGDTIYSLEELGTKSYAVDKEELISGLQEGIKLMKIGETITFVIPSYRAFGLVGDGDKIGINQTIKSTVTLVNIKEE